MEILLSLIAYNSDHDFYLLFAYQLGRFVYFEQHMIWLKAIKCLIESCLGGFGSEYILVICR